MNVQCRLCCYRCSCVALVPASRSPSSRHRRRLQSATRRSVEGRPRPGAPSRPPPPPRDAIGPRRQRPAAATPPPPPPARRPGPRLLGKRTLRQAAYERGPLRPTVHVRCCCRRLRNIVEAPGQLPSLASLQSGPVDLYSSSSIFHSAHVGV